MNKNKVSIGQVIRSYIKGNSNPVEVKAFGFYVSPIDHRFWMEAKMQSVFLEACAKGEGDPRQAVFQCREECFDMFEEAGVSLASLGFVERPRQPLDPDNDVKVLLNRALKGEKLEWDEQGRLEYYVERHLRQQALDAEVKADEAAARAARKPGPWVEIPVALFKATEAGRKWIADHEAKCNRGRIYYHKWFGVWPARRRQR